MFAAACPKHWLNYLKIYKLIIPNYQAIKISENIRFLCSIHVDNREQLIFLKPNMPDSHVTVWLVDYPESTSTIRATPMLTNMASPGQSMPNGLRYFAGSPLKRR